MVDAWIDDDGLASRQQRGFTLTELSIVLGVIGLILAAIWVAAAQAYNNQKTAKGAVEALQVLSNYKTLYGRRGIDIAGQIDVTCLGVNAGFFPSDMLQSACVTGNSTTYPSSPFGSASAGQYVEVYTLQSNNTIGIVFWGLSQAACDSLSNAIFNTNMTYQQINNVNVNWLPPYGPGPAWTSSQINSFCVAGNANIVVVGIAAR